MDALIGVVLAGGSGSRIGASKATLELGGRPLISYPLAAMAAAGIETFVVAKPDTALPQMENEVWLEPQQPSHPLLGIVTALERAGGRPVLVCGCDMPFVTAQLIAHVAHGDGPIVLPFAGGRYHPLLARYRPSLTPMLASALEQQQPLQRVVVGLAPALIDELGLARFGDPERLLFNVNTPADLERARRLLKG